VSDVDTLTIKLLDFHRETPLSVVSQWKHWRDPKIDWNTLKTYTPTLGRNTLRGEDTNFGMVKEVSMNS
jgi:hypothetical protein